MNDTPHFDPRPGTYLRLRLKLNDARDVIPVTKALTLLGHMVVEDDNELIITTPQGE